MKIARVTLSGVTWLGTINNDETSFTPVTRLDKNPSNDVLIDLITSGTTATLLNSIHSNVPLEEVEFLPPISRPDKNIICVGKNYRAHAAEFSKSGFDSSSASSEVVPEAPILFSKAACTMTGANGDIEVPWAITDKVDYEAELGVVVGKAGRFINRKDAMDYVFGYTVINDVTARDLQAKHKQWLLGKSIDTFCPIGPWLTTADEVQADSLEVRCWVNSELRQQANTQDLIFDIPTIIEVASASMSLKPGDIIATGTPAGVGIGFTPPKFLHSGDSVKVSIAGLGTIENKIV